MAMTACAAKFCQQINLLVGEGTNLQPIDVDCSDQFVVFEHRYAEEVSAPHQSWMRAGTRSPLVCDVGNVNWLAWSSSKLA